MKCTVAFLAYNEEDVIEQTVRAGLSALRKVSGEHTWEVLVIDNASTDATAQKVEALSREYPCVRLIRHDRNFGYGASNLTALRQATGNRIAIVDGDGQLALDDLALMLRECAAGAAVVYGWRVVRKDSWLRLGISAGLNYLSRVWLGWPYHDINCGYRMFTREAAEQIRSIRPTNFVGPELWVKAKLEGWKVTEVPVRHAPRLRGVSVHSITRLPGSIASAIHHLYELRRELRAHTQERHNA